MDIYKFTGKKLKNLREELSFSQEFVAESANISLSRLRKIERGEARLTISLLSCICKVLSVMPVELLKDFENKND